MYVKISKRGQITIPKSIRQRLNVLDGGGILILDEESGIRLEGIPESNDTAPGGSLKEYARHYTPLDQVRKAIEAEMAEEIAKEGL